MSNFTGMDIPAVRQMATQLKSQADQIDQIQRQLTNLLQGTAWVGPDRERYMGEWSGQHCSALNRVTAGLRDAASKAEQNANEQEQVSSR